MTDLRKAAEMALVTLEEKLAVLEPTKYAETIEALRQALAQPEHEPVAWGFRRIIDGVILDIKNSDEHEGYEETYTVPLYTAPPKHEWVGLTDEERVSFFTKSQNKFWDWDDGIDIEAFIRAIEAKLKEKNT